VSKAHAIIVCTGLSTRSLGGVEDLTMRPLRGQVVLLRAPWIKFGLTARGFGVDENGHPILTYIIPRRNGDVCLVFSFFSTYDLVIFSSGGCRWDLCT
jgi:D-amino-acid oxidase